MCEISIIVPVYKVEKYLDKCVTSILNQTFTDFELILVDDGSPDNSGKMCDEYAKKDYRVRVIHKANGGLSDARNVALDVACGKYIGFIDSDDYIDQDMYETLYKNLKDSNADLSVIGMYDVYANREPKIVDEELFVLNQKEAIKFALDGRKLAVSANNKLYKRELFEEIRYPKGKLTEDAFVIMEILLRCATVVISTKQKYYYFHREDSITTTKFSTKYLDIIDAWSYNETIILEHYPDLKKQAKRRVYWAYFTVLDKIVVNDEEDDVKETKQLVKFLRKNIISILLNEGFENSRKIAAIALLFNVKAYKTFPKLQQRIIYKKNS